MRRLELAFEREDLLADELKGDEQDGDEADGEVELPGSEAPHQQSPDADTNDDTGDQVFEVILPPFAPVMIHGKEVARAKERQDHTEGEGGAAAYGSKRHDAQGRCEHPQCTAEPGLGQADEQHAQGR